MFFYSKQLKLNVIWLFLFMLFFMLFHVICCSCYLLFMLCYFLLSPGATQGHVSIYVMNQTLELEFLLLLNKMQH